jgi:radical SAM protein with 4Fe4S-binding SPASM domain
MGTTFLRTIGYVTLKVTPHCNLTCPYCSVAARLPKGNITYMPLELYCKVVDTVFAESHALKIGLEFHGGEPLLIPQAWYEEAVIYATNRAKQKGKCVHFRMQTNATLLSVEKARWLRSLGIGVGISLDGTDDINVITRGDKTGRAGHNLKALTESLERVGLLLVLSKANYNRMPEIMDYFRSLGVSRFRASPIRPLGRGLRSPLLLTGEELALAFINIFRHMEADTTIIEEGVMRYVRRFVSGRQAESAPFGCWEYQCQAGRTYISIDYLGFIYACGCVIDPVWRLGHIDNPATRADINPILDRLHNKDSWYERCIGCRASSICNFGCTIANIGAGGSRNHLEVECEATRMFYSFLSQHSGSVEQLANAVPSLRKAKRFAPQP